MIFSHHVRPSEFGNPISHLACPKHPLRKDTGFDTLRLSNNCDGPFEGEMFSRVSVPITEDYRPQWCRLEVKPEQRNESPSIRCQNMKKKKKKPKEEKRWNDGRGPDINNRSRNIHDERVPNDRAREQPQSHDGLWTHFGAQERRNQQATSHETCSGTHDR